MSKILSGCVLVLALSSNAYANAIALEGLSVTLSVSTSAFVITDTLAVTNAAAIDVEGFGGLFDITAVGDEILIEVIADIPIEGFPDGQQTVRLHFENWSRFVFPVVPDLQIASWGGPSVPKGDFYIQFSGGGFSRFFNNPYDAGDTLHLSLDDTRAAMPNVIPANAPDRAGTGTLLAITVFLLAWHQRRS